MEFTSCIALTLGQISTKKRNGYIREHVLPISHPTAEQTNLCVICDERKKSADHECSSLRVASVQVVHRGPQKTLQISIAHQAAEQKSMKSVMKEIS
jgi:hypothetical protein